MTQLNIPRYSTESEKMVPGHDAEPLSAFLSSPDFYGQSAAAQRYVSLSLKMLEFFALFMLAMVEKYLRT